MLYVIFNYKGKQRTEEISSVLLATWLNNGVLQSSDIIFVMPVLSN